MATYNIDFGVKTRSGCGAPRTITTLSGSISGTGASDWALTADGSIAPSGTYLAFKTFSKAAGETYNLTVGSDTVNITMVAARADITFMSGDTSTSNQFKTMFQLAYNAPGALLVTDSVYIRDGTIYDLNVALTSASIAMPAHGFGGFGTVTAAGSGYTTGTYAASGGSGTSAQLYIFASGGVVQHATVVDPGIGYQAGDELTVPGGNGAFRFTVIDLTAKITVRSETPNLTTLANGNLRRGGGAIIANIVIGAQQATPYVPIHFKYIDFVMQREAPARTRFVEYRAKHGYGVSASYNYCAVPDEFDPSVSDGIEAFVARLCTIDSNYCYNCENVTTADGIGCYVSFHSAIDVPDNTVIRRYTINNVAENSIADTYKISGTKNEVHDNFAFNYRRLPGSQAHQDGIQHAGFGALGYTLTDVAKVTGNVFIRGTGNGTAGVPQPIIFTDTDPPTQQTGVEFINNLSISGSPTGITIPACIGPVIERNTAICLSSWPDGAGDAAARIYVKQGTGGYVDRNICNVMDINREGEPPQDGIEITAENAVITNKALYSDYFHNPVYDTSLTTRAGVIERFKAKLNGSAKNADGTYNGAFFPDGTKNDGTIYQATPPTSISQSANVSSVTVGQPVVITYQLDAAASQSVTVTPGVAGVTGSFSAATAVIGVGEASAQLTFTPTSAGTATLSATDNRSLTGPDNIAVTVTSASATPTSYTQTADRTVVTIGAGILITYTLNEVAATAVTITPAVSGVSGVFSSATVTIGVGQTTGNVSFFPSTTGSGTLTASDDQSLTDPAGISFTVAVCNVGQLVKLGMR